MNVMFVHGNSNIIGGQEMSLLYRMKGLRDNGFDSIVIMPQAGVLADLFREHDFKVRFIPLNRLKKKNPFPYFKTVICLYKTLKAEKISIIHCSGAFPTQYCLPAARLRRIPCVTHINSTVYTKHDFIRSFVHHTDRVITVCEAARQQIIQSINMAPEKIKTIYNAFVIKEGNLRKNQLEEIRKKFNIPNDTKIVGQIGQIIPRKGLEYFVQMARIVKDQYPNVKFMIVGDAPKGDENYKLKIERLIQELNLAEDCILTGFQKDVQSYYKILDISVLASLAEGLARGAIESLAFERPMVSTNVSGMPEIIINEKTGLLTPPKEPQKLANAVLRMLKNEAEAKQFATEGKKFVEKTFTIANHAQAVARIYNMILK